MSSAFLYNKAGSRTMEKNIKGPRIELNINKRTVVGLVHLLPLRRLYRAYPEILNYSITEKCNCRCLMCDIQAERQKSLAWEGYRTLYGRKLFKAVKYVGITGGEPFLLDDLPDHVEVLVRRLPRLRSITFITNGLLSDMTTAAMDRILATTATAGVRTNLCVSFDGLGSHDTVRSVPGAEKKVLETIAELDRRYRGRLELEAHFTVSMANVRSMESTYFHFRDLGIPIKFRLAVPIARLHNEEKMGRVRLGAADKLKVCEFLDKLIYDDPCSLRDKVFYRSLQDELLTGARKRDCFYRYNAVGMDSRGHIFYCAPCSKVLNPGEEDPTESFFSRPNLEYRKEFTRRCCPSCHHDYPGPMNAYMLGRLAEIKFRRARNVLLFLAGHLLSHAPRFPRNTKPDKCPGIALHGWYGTETIGDKAILGGVIKMLKGIYPGRQVRVFSSMPHFTEHTLAQLPYPGIVVDRYDLKNIRASIRRNDIQVLAGGPLMDIPGLLPIEYAFVASRAEKQVIGCGLGPLFSQFYARSVGRILNSADRILLRDEGSLQAARGLIGADRDIRVAADPALHFYSGYKPAAQANGNAVGFALRKIQRQYLAFPRDFERLEEGFDRDMQLFIKNIGQGAEVSFLSMSTYFRGHDDREYYLKLLAGDPDLRARIVLESLTLDDTIERFAGMSYMIAMRYHSIIFSIITEVPFLAIMYDLGKGKIGNLIRELGLEEFAVSIGDFSAEKAVRKFEELKADRGRVVERLREFKRTKNAEFEAYLGQFVQ